MAHTTALLVLLGTAAGAFGQDGGCDPSAVWFGEDEKDRFGRAVDFGDVNADGVDEIVIGAPEYFHPNIGRVYVVSADGLGGVLWHTGQVFGEIGTSVAGIDDVDGDGAPDVVAGAPFVGTARVLSGSDGALIHALQTSGSEGPDEFGIAGADGFDVTGDGVREIIVGAWSFDTGIEAGGQGKASVFDPVAGDELTAFVGTEVGGGLGRSVAGGGDVDGDGTPDWLAGAPGEAGGAGRVYAFSGADGAVVGVYEGSQATGAGLGFSVAWVPDVDGDGADDVWAGAPGEQRAWLFSGATGEVLLESPGGAGHGWSVAAGPDFDGDGIGDLAVGAPDAGGDGLGRAAVYSGRTLACVRLLAGGAGDGGFGGAVALIPDQNGDANADLLVGAPDTDHEGLLGVGSVSHFRGGLTGDFNCDGMADVLDFVAFQQAWQAQDPAADCDANGEFNVVDFVCFQERFQTGCP